MRKLLVDWLGSVDRGFYEQTVACYEERRDRDLDDLAVAGHRLAIYSDALRKIEALETPRAAHGVRKAAALARGALLKAGASGPRKGGGRLMPHQKHERATMRMIRKTFGLKASVDTRNRGTNGHKVLTVLDGEGGVLLRKPIPSSPSNADTMLREIERDVRRALDGRGESV